MSYTLDGSGRKIYPWWVPTVLTILIAFLSVPFIFGIAYLYLRFWHQPLLNCLDKNFDIFTNEQLGNYLSFTFDKLINLWTTQLTAVLYNAMAFVSSIIIGIRRKRVYSDYMIFSLKEQVVERAGKVGEAYKDLSAKKIRIKALLDLLNLDEFEAGKLMELRTTTGAAGLEKIYAMSVDANAFACCMKQIFESAFRESCKFLKINGIAQYEFIGKFERYFNKRDGTIDEYGFTQSPFLHLLEVKENINFKILLMDPCSPNSNKIIKKRIASIQSLKKPISVNSYKKDIEATINFVEYLKKNLSKFDRFNNKNINIDYRLYDDEPIFRYYITEDTLFLGQYVEGDHGHKSMVFQINKSKKTLYYSFSNLFEKRWEKYN